MATAEKVAEFISPAALSNSRAMRFVDSRVHRGRGGVFAEVVRISPEIAEILLAQNDQNRNVNPVNVRKIARQIEAGKFDLNGETIKIAKDGSLNDGQHRLLAVVKVNQSIDSVVVFGLERDTRFTADAGQKRNAGQLLKMRGKDNYNYRAKIASMLLQWTDERQVTRAPKYDNTEIFDFHERAEEKIDAAIDFANHLQSHCITLCGTTSWPAFCYAVFRDIDADAACEFMTQLITGEGATGSINAARTQILKERHRAMLDRTQYHSEAFVRIVFMAWNAWRAGEDRKFYRHSENFPIPA